MDKKNKTERLKEQRPGHRYGCKPSKQIPYWTLKA